MIPDLSTRDITATERMDEPDADAAMLERTYDRFRLVNGVVSRVGVLYRRDIRPRALHGSVRILDIGSGGADVCRSIAARLRRDGLRGEITAVDADARAVRWARNHDEDFGIVHLHARSGDLIGTVPAYDVVFSNHVLHHLTPRELATVLTDSERLVAPGGVVVHRDIARGLLAYAAFGLATAPLATTLLRGSFIREDGLVSIRRAYTPRELSAAVPGGWVVRGGFPARVEVRWDAPNP